MQIFITGTDTDIGKTTVSSWLCLHSTYSYFKPIQTGSDVGSDSKILSKIIQNTIYPEIYCYKKPLSPHLASSLENQEINLENIILPKAHNLIVEGAGGVLVPINKNQLIIDLIKYLELPVILVTKPYLGTINHTLLSIAALSARQINILGFIMNGEENKYNSDAIEYYGKIPLLATIPTLTQITKESLLNIPLTDALKAILR